MIYIQFKILMKNEIIITRIIITQTRIINVTNGNEHYYKRFNFIVLKDSRVVTFIVLRQIGTGDGANS